MNDCELMGIRLDADFVYDARGRMLHSNSPDRLPPPRLLVARTLAGDVGRFGESVPDDVARRLTEIVERLPSPADLADLVVPPTVRTALRETLERHMPIAQEGSGPNYRFPAVIPVLGETVEVTASNLDVARATFPWLERGLSAWGPCFAVPRDGVAVSVCFCARIGARVVEAGVFTLADFRERGHAATATAAWGAAMRASGKIPVYTTSWDNLASQGVARRVGLIQFGTDFQWT